MWADFESADTNLLNAVGTQFDLLAGFVTAGGSTQGVTVVRTIIQLICRPNVAGNGVLGSDRFRVGLIVGEVPAAASVPDFDPVGRPYLDWALNDMKTGVGASGISGTPPNAAIISEHRWDIGAKRKIQEVGQSWILALFLKSWAGVGGANFLIHTRTLLLLP